MKRFHTKRLNKRLIILTNVLAPYRIPLFNNLHRDIDFEVLTCNDIEVNRFWEIEHVEFKHHTLFGIKFNYSLCSDEPKYIYIMPSVLSYAFRQNTFFLIGDASWTSYIFAIFLTILGKRYHLWTEHTLASPRRGGPLGIIRKVVVNRAEKVFCPGSLTISYLRNIEGRDNNIVILHNTPAEVYYRNIGICHRKKVKNELKFIYVGQLIERKSIRDIVGLPALAKTIGINCSVDLVGDGELRHLVQEQSCESNVNYLGRVGPRELCSIYRNYDALVLLSIYEPWGLVVNEALLCGTPCLVAASVGSSDLINSKNGVIVRASYDDSDLIAALNELNNYTYDHELIREESEMINPDSSAFQLLSEL